MQHYINNKWELGDDCFIFWKIKPLVDQYAKFFASIPNFRVKHMLELGLWDGGSTAFWFELLKPHKYIGVDRSQRKDSSYFRTYTAAKGITERVKTYCGTNQTDSSRLASLVTNELDGELSLMIDDASPQYEATKRSFETLFPRIEPGGY